MNQTFEILSALTDVLQPFLVLIVGITAYFIKSLIKEVASAKTELVSTKVEIAGIGKALVAIEKSMEVMWPQINDNTKQVAVLSEKVKQIELRLSSFDRRKDL